MIRPVEQIPGQERLIPDGKPPRQDRWISGQPFFLRLRDGIEIVGHGGEVILLFAAVEVIAPEVPVAEIKQHHRILGQPGQLLCQSIKGQFSGDQGLGALIGGGVLTLVQINIKLRVSGSFLHR